MDQSNASGTSLKSYKAAVYPNPVQDFANLNVETENNETIQVNIVSLNGELVHENSLSTQPGINAAKIDCSGLKPGVYTLQLIAPSGTKVLKIVKE